MTIAQIETKMLNLKDLHTLLSSRKEASEEMQTIIKEIKEMIDFLEDLLAVLREKAALIHIKYIIS